MTRLVAVLTLFVVATTVFKAADSHSKVCPMQFEYVGGRCLHLHRWKMTHRLAKAYCKSFGAMLVTPRTPYEYRSLKALLQYQSFSNSFRKISNIWIGLKNIGTGHRSDNYVWEDGYNTTLTWSSWAPGWPDSDRGRCVIYRGWFDSWVNYKCATHENVMCQIGTPKIVENAHKDCYYIDHAELYTGTESQTSDGIVCQRWDRQKPHQHHYTQPSFFQDGISHNYCRNKIGEHYNPWCYTIDPYETWGYCNVKECACDGVNFFPDVNNKCMYYHCDGLNLLFHVRCTAGLMWSQSDLKCLPPLDPSETCI